MQKIDLLPSENGQYSSDRGPAPVLMSDTTCAHRLWPDADAEECYHRHRKKLLYIHIYILLSQIFKSQESHRVTFGISFIKKSCHSILLSSVVIGFPVMNIPTIPHAHRHSKMTADKRRRSFQFGRSGIIGFQKTQIYQRFAGSRKEVFILKL